MIHPYFFAIKIETYVRFLYCHKMEKYVKIHDRYCMAGRKDDKNAYAI